MTLSHAFLTKLLAFCTAVEVQSNQKNYPTYPDLHEKVRPSLERVNKYVRIYFDRGVQKSSRYFVRVSDGAIFACKSWKAPNLNRQFGTLDTIDEFDWSGYEGVARPDSRYTMVGTYGPYRTAVLKECRRCGSTMKGDRCTDVTCPYSDHPQSDERFKGPTD